MAISSFQYDLMQLISQQSIAPKSAELVFSEHYALWQSLGFSQTQVALWLASLSQKNQQNELSSAYQITPDIAAHLVSLLQQAGGRMPLAQVLKKLPAGITTSEQQIRKLAHQHPQLDIKGPLLILLN
ncbi:hypothetical protein [Pseudoalteromonas prydzensis]|uniref:hypothetical protein n=1 Tax=Pseudoalteromonas prydzensis TaxID=182141 RepID=UPI0007E51F11|nr:hypothetical protein [Pseudoalteromonas prydzensis]MBE0378124.1 hypothetical protein [Pseudoalteromonas prydzensis ACAM 620]